MKERKSVKMEIIMCPIRILTETAHKSMHALYFLSSVSHLQESDQFSSKIVMVDEARRVICVLCEVCVWREDSVLRMQTNSLWRREREMEFLAFILIKSMRVYVML
jgi:hypothetical protein